MLATPLIKESLIRVKILNKQDVSDSCKRKVSIRCKYINGKDASDFIKRYRSFAWVEKMLAILAKDKADSSQICVKKTC